MNDKKIFIESINAWGFAVNRRAMGKSLSLNSLLKLGNEIMFVHHF